MAEKAEGNSFQGPDGISQVAAIWLGFPAVGRLPWQEAEPGEFAETRCLDFLARAETEP